MQAIGMVHKFGNHIDTDVIIPGRYLNISDLTVLSTHCMEDLDPNLVSRIGPGDLFVAGENFGCGSSREHAPAVIKEVGVSCIIAKSFSRIFFRNAINIGLPILACADAAGETEDGDRVLVDFSQGVIQNQTSGKTYRVPPYPPFIEQMIAQGGLINYVNHQLL